MIPTRVESCLLARFARSSTTIIVSKAIIKKRPNGLGKGKRPKKRVSIPWQTYFRLEYNSETKIRQKLDTRRQKRYFGAQCLKIAKILSFLQRFRAERATLHFSKNQHQSAYFWPKDSSRLNPNAPHEMIFLMLNSFGVKIQTRQF